MKKFIISDELFSGFTLELDPFDFESSNSLKETAIYILGYTLRSHNLEILESKLLEKEFHCCDPFEKILGEEGPFYICSHRHTLES